MSPAARAVLTRIQKSPLRPTGLLTDFGAEYSYSEIQDAVSDLLETGDVILTSDLLLQPTGLQEAF
ncbi:MAG: hypothetical protein ABR987_16280 [Terracidiphilus sp.]|jgi:hypothetical protein